MSIFSRQAQHTRYHLRLAAPANGRIPAPGEIKVPAHIYDNARTRGLVQVTLRGGAFGVPWIEALNP